MAQHDPEEPLVQGAPVAGIPYRWVSLALVCLGVFLATLDSSITNIALPTLADEFDAEPSEVVWVTLIFIVVSTGLALIMGRLGDVHGRKRLYVMGFALFMLAAGAAALAGSLPELLGARAVQAVGSSLVLANGAAIIASSFPASQRGRALGFQVATVGAGVATGPVLGGVLVDLLDWRAIFWTRLPLGLFGAVLVWRFLRDAEEAKRPRGLDLSGSLLIFGLLACLVLGVNRGEAWGWTSAPIVALFASSASLLVLFLCVERRAASPVVDLLLFKRRSYSAAISAAILQFFGLSAVIILMPFYLVEARGYSTLEAGGISAALPIAMLLLSPISGGLADRFAPRVIATIGIAFAAAGLLFLATIDADTSVAGIAVRLFVIGTGAAIFSSPNTSTIMASVPPERLGTASASQTTARTFGNSIGIAVATALYSAQAASYALARSDLGLADPAVESDALVSGIRLAFVVGASVTLLGIPASLMRGARVVQPPAPASATTRA